MSLEGTWIITQQWGNGAPYRFPATFASNGTITVEGGYFGFWTQLGSSNQVALAIADFSPPSITSYNGNVVGPLMGGEMTGGAPKGQVHSGDWTARRQAHAEAPKGPLKPPGQ